jgi:anti-sigma B factor antagonist
VGDAEDIVVRTTDTDGAIVVAVVGELDMSTVPTLRTAIDAAVRRGRRQLVVDLGAVSFADASALGALVAAHRTLAEVGGGLVVRNPSPALERVLRITRVSEILDVDRGDATAGP